MVQRQKMQGYQTQEGKFIQHTGKLKISMYCKKSAGHLQQTKLSYLNH